jgi:hypothetical protein
MYYNMAWYKYKRNSHFKQGQQQQKAEEQRERKHAIKAATIRAA